MLTLILVMLLVWFALSGLIAAWTLFLQGYIYSEPVEQVLWRAAAAGTVLAVFLSLWVLLAYKYPGRYETLPDFSYTQVQEPPKELIAMIEGREQTFKRSKGSDRRWHFTRAGRPLPSRPEQIIILEKGQKATFVPDRDEAGNFKVEPGRGLRYRDERGRWMEEGSFGEIETFKPGWLIGNLILNFIHLALWFLCLWLIMQFQWSHALGQAFVFWIVMMLFILPQLLTRAETVAALSRAAG